MSRLRSMKRYFLLDSADFLVSFLDLASDELSRKASDVSQTKLQNLWDLSTGGKTDNFRVEISSKSFLDTVLRIIAKGRHEQGEMPSSAGGMTRNRIVDPGVVIGLFDGGRGRQRLVADTSRSRIRRLRARLPDHLPRLDYPQLPHRNDV